MSRRIKTHLRWADGRAACGQESAVDLVADVERTTCAFCLAVARRGRRGRSDRSPVTFSRRAAWNADLGDGISYWVEVRGRRFRTWPNPYGGWHVEEVDEDGEPAGYATLDRAHPGERRVVWVGGWYARAASLRDARAVLAAEIGLDAPQKNR